MLVKLSTFNIILKVDSNLVKVQILEVRGGGGKNFQIPAEMTKWQEVSFIEMR